VIVDNLNVGRTFTSPAKTYPPLIIDPDGVLAMTIAPWRFKPIGRRNTKIGKPLSGFQRLEFPASH
jgi:hypothetical protein